MKKVRKFILFILVVMIIAILIALALPKDETVRIVEYDETTSYIVDGTTLIQQPTAVSGEGFRVLGESIRDAVGKP